MNETAIGNKLKAQLIGAMVGAITGYLLTDLILWKVLEKEFFDEELTELIQLSKPTDEINPIFTERPDKQKVDYSSFSEKEDLGVLVEKYKSDAPPYVVNLSERQHLVEEGAAEAVIVYYEDDNTYCDEKEEIIDDPMAILGPNPNLRFGDQSADPDTVYIMNERMGVLYEIMRLEESYAIQVLGEIPKPPKPQRRKRAAKPEAEEEGKDANSNTDDGRE